MAQDISSYIPEDVAHVAEVLEKAGFEAYLVGGCVRDLLLDRTPKDWDVTTDALPAEIVALFPETFQNNDFGTVGVVTGSEEPSCNVVEVTPYRIESGYSDARRPDRVSFGTSLDEDLKRRDFTINALAYRVSQETLVDRFDGLGDLAARRIRAVGEPGERFAEDALRMLRAVRLSVELNCVIEAATLDAIAQNASNLSRISKERIREEFVRIVSSPAPMQGILLCEKLGLLEHIAPDLLRGIGVEQNKAHAFTVYEHLLRTLQHAADQGWPLHIRLAALFHDISKPETRRRSPETGEWTFYGHEVVGARVTKKVLEDLRFPRETVHLVSKLVRWHMFFSDPDTVTLAAVRRTIQNVGEDHIWDLLNLRICDRIGTGRPKAQPFRFRKYKAMVEEALRDPISAKMLRIDGERIMALSGQQPGPKVGFTLHALLEEVLDDPAKNTPVYLEKRAQELLALPDHELKQRGEQGKEKRIREEKEALRAIHKRHGVAKEG